MPKRQMIRHSVIQPRNASYRLIPLTQGKNAIVDVKDFAWLSQWNWYAVINRHKLYERFYAKRCERNGKDTRIIPMHAEILGGPGDHKNRNTLDNRRKNLRKCTTAQNNRNRQRLRTNKSGFKGVNWHQNRWVSRITSNGKTVSLGRFRRKEEAARAYNQAAVKLHGEFASINKLS